MYISFSDGPYAVSAEGGERGNILLARDG